MVRKSLVFSISEEILIFLKSDNRAHINAWYSPFGECYVTALSSPLIFYNHHHHHSLACHSSHIQGVHT